MKQWLNVGEPAKIGWNFEEAILDLWVFVM